RYYPSENACGCLTLKLTCKVPNHCARSALPKCPCQVQRTLDSRFGISAQRVDPLAMLRNEPAVEQRQQPPLFGRRKLKIARRDYTAARGRSASTRPDVTAVAIDDVVVRDLVARLDRPQRDNVSRLVDGPDEGV